MQNNYADILESYLIPAEESDNSSWSRKEKLQAAAVGLGAIAGTAWLIRDYKKSKDQAKQREKERQEREAADKRKKEEQERFEKNQIHLEFSRKKALQETRLNLNPIPDKDPNILKDILLAIKKDLRVALPKILATKEVNDGIETYCNRYNNCPKEERNDRFYDMASDYAPDKIDSRWVKKQFRIGNDDWEEDRLYFDVCDHRFFWRYGTNAIQDVLIMYILKRYEHYVTSSDNSEKGWIEFESRYDIYENTFK